MYFRPPLGTVPTRTRTPKTSSAFLTRVDRTRTGIWADGTVKHSARSRRRMAPMRTCRTLVQPRAFRIELKEDFFSVSPTIMLPPHLIKGPMFLPPEVDIVPARSVDLRILLSRALACKHSVLGQRTILQHIMKTLRMLVDWSRRKLSTSASNTTKTAPLGSINLSSISGRRFPVTVHKVQHKEITRRKCMFNYL